MARNYFLIKQNGFDLLAMAVQSHVLRRSKTDTCDKLLLVNGGYSGHRIEHQIEDDKAMGECRVQSAYFWQTYVSNRRLRNGQTRNSGLVFE